MARRKNDRPTVIYWLIDVRPSVLAISPDGLPFYCGKTVLGVKARFNLHLFDARRTNRPSAVRLRECGNHVRIQIMETVPPEGNWVDAERRWISILRSKFPESVNVTNGGQGAPGHIHTDAARAKMSAARRGKAVSAEHRAKLSAALKGRKLSAEICAKMSTNRMGKPLSLAHRAATSAGRKGIVFSAEQLANMRTAHLGKKQSAETIEKKAAACRGQKRSPETRAKMSAAQKGKTFSAERCAAMRDARLGKKHSLETRTKMRAAQKARRSAEVMA